jgi:hypothetical protein
VDVSAAAATSGHGGGGEEFAALRSQQIELQAEVAELRALVERLYTELGIQRG